MEKKCEFCRFWTEGVCGVPLYVDSKFYPGSERGADESCWLYEEKERGGAMIYLANAFSVGMLPYAEMGTPRELEITRISAREVFALLHDQPFHSVYGHAGTAWHLSRYLQVRVPVQRKMIRLSPGDVLIVARANLAREDHWDPSRAPKWQFFRVEIRV